MFLSFDAAKMRQKRQIEKRISTKYRSIFDEILIFDVFFDEKDLYRLPPRALTRSSQALRSSVML